MDYSGKDAQILDEVVRAPGQRLAATTWDLSYNKLRNLELSRPSELDAQDESSMGAVTNLNVSHNTLTSLKGMQRFNMLTNVNLSHNSLRSLDGEAAKALESLQLLTVLDCSNNHITYVHFRKGLKSLRALDLSKNMLEDLPKVAACEHLVDLRLSQNHIADLTSAGDLVEVLPVASLEELDMQGNLIDDWFQLTALSALDELRRIKVGGNRFCTEASKEFHWRSFLYFLLPVLETIDDERPSDQEEQLTSILFRNEPRGTLDPQLMGLVNDRKALREYLRVRCQLQPPVRSVSGTGSMSGQMADASDIEQLKASVKQIQYVVKLLHKQDMKARDRAARKIQGMFRSVLVRRRLPTHTRRVLRQIGFRIRYPGADFGDEPKKGGEVRSPEARHQRSIVSPDPVSTADVTVDHSKQLMVLEGEVQHLAEVSKRMWNDFHHMKAFLQRQRQAAAMTIWRHYLGWKGRQYAKSVRNEFNRFRSKFLHHVVLMQRTGRMFMERRRVAVEIARRRENRRLRATVADLSSRVEDLERTLRVVLPLVQSRAGSAPNPAKAGPQEHIPVPNARPELLHESVESDDDFDIPLPGHQVRTGRGSSSRSPSQDAGLVEDFDPSKEVDEDGPGWSPKGFGEY